MSRSMGARRRSAVPSPRLPRAVFDKDGGLKYSVGSMFWISAEIAENPLNEALRPGELRHPSLVRRPGATIRRITDPNGNVGYCHAEDYKKKVAEFEAIKRERNEI